MQFNELTSDDLRIILSVGLGIVIAITGCIRTRLIIKRREQQKKKAIETGDIIKAGIVKTWRDSDDDTYHGVYEYTINGKTKRYSVSGGYGTPCSYLNLYYDDVSKKVFSDYDRPQLGYNFSILLGIIAGVAVMFFTNRM